MNWFDRPYQERRELEEAAQAAPALLYELDNLTGCGAGHRFSLQPVYVHPRDGEAQAYTYREDGHNHLADLEIAAYFDATVYPDRAYGWSVAYRDVFSVELDRAEVMVKTLRAIRRKLVALEEKYGPAATFGEFAARVADALKIGRALQPPVNGDRHWLNGERYREGTPGDLARWVRDAEYRLANPD